MVGAGGDLPDLLFSRHAAHDGEHLAGQHHPHSFGEDAFHRPAMVVVVAVVPALRCSGVDPLVFLEPAGEPVCLLFQAVGQLCQRYLHLVAADLVGAAGGVPGQNVLLCPGVVKGFGLVAAQNQQLFQDPGGMYPGGALQQPDHPGQFPQVAGVGAGEGHAFAPLGGHVQRVIPVCAPEAADVVLAHLIERGQLLDQQMLQDGAGVDFPLACTLPAALLRLVCGIDLGAAHGLGILEIRSLAVEDFHIAGLVDVELGGHLGPEGVVHPDTGDAVAVGDEIAVAGPDDGGVGAVDPDTAEILLNHPAHVAGVHQQQGQAVLPEIPPAPAAPAVIMVGEEGAAEEPPQERLEADPFHQVVKVRVPGAERDVDFFFPVAAGAVQCGLYLVPAVVLAPNGSNGFLAVLHPQQQDIMGFLAGGQGDGREPEGPHGLPAFCGAAGLDPGILLIDGAGVKIGPALAQEGLHSGVEGFRFLALGPKAAYIIYFVVGPVAPLVKGHGGPDHHPVFGGPDPVEHRGHIPVVPDVVGAAAIQGDGCDGGQPAGLILLVAHRDAEDLHIVLPGAEGCHPGVKAQVFGGALHRLPHQAGGEPAVVLGRGKAVGFLSGRGARHRECLPILVHQPEVPHTAVAVEIFGADRFQQKGLLVDFGVPSQIGGESAFQPCLGGQGKVQITDIFRLVHGEAAVLIHELQVVHDVSPFYGKMSILLYRKGSAAKIKTMNQSVRIMTLFIYRHKTLSRI